MSRSSTGSLLKRAILIGVLAAGAGELHAQARTDTVPDDFRRAPSLADALIARYPGVSVLYSSGVTGAGSAVRLRGNSAILTPHEPLLMIDGIWVHGAQTSTILDVGGGVRSSRLDDVDPDDVERIEILPGPAAAALYGIGAGRGVIRITTRRDSAGPTRVRGFIEGGAMSDAADYPANFTSVGTPPPIPGDSRCYVQWQADGLCTLESLGSWNAIEGASPYRTGSRLSAGASVSGGSGVARFAVSAARDHDEGVWAENEATRTRLRARVGTRFGGIDFSLDGSHLDGMIAFPGGTGQNTMLAAGLLGSGIDNEVFRGYDPTIREIAMRTRSHQDFTHSTVGLRAEGSPREWLTTRATIGVDDARRSEDQRVPRVSGGIITSDDDQLTAAADFRTLTAAVAASATTVRGRWRANTTVSIDHRRERQTDELRKASMVPFPDATWCGFAPSLCGAVSGDRLARARTALTGLVVHGDLIWHDQVQLGGGIRVDEGSVRDTDIDARVSTSLSASWTVPGMVERFGSVVSSMRVHAAYGRAHDHRGLISPLQPRPAGGLGPTPPPLSPERLTELEGGVQVGMFGGRGWLGITAFRTDTDGGVILAPFPYSTGYVTVLRNALRTRTVGVEASARARVLDTRTVTWDFDLTGTRHRSRYDRGVAGLTGSGWGMMQYGISGHALVSYWGGPTTYSDENGDGIIERSEVLLHILPPTIEYGPSLPTTDLGLRSTMALFGALTAGAVLDYRGGHQMLNLTNAARCVTRQACRENHDPASPIEDQAHAIVGLAGSMQGYVRDADFLKLREVSLGVRIPAALARVVGGSATLTLVGRNLATWTDYTGLDPEVTSGGAQSPVRYDLFAQPLPRSVTARVDLAW